MSLLVGVDDYSSESDVLIIPSALDFVSQDEMLTPLGRLDKYIASENTFNRQMVARGLLDTLKAVSDDEKDCLAVLERISKLAEDPEPTVRAELMEQVPHIAIFCQENRPSIPYAFSKYLLPFMVRCLADPNNQVRKTSQAALLVVLEHELIERYDVETKVCPVLLDLTAPESNDDLKTEAVAIMCKMAPMVGKDITERFILHRFCEMCCDCRMFHVRKVCAANFGEISSVVGREATEELLLPRFFQLCSDNVWGVRKACAECFMGVSCATSQDVRRTKLSSLFINLISDPSRWVRQAAFQSLGPFISTFANPSSADQYFKEDLLSPRNVVEGKGTESDNGPEIELSPKDELISKDNSECSSDPNCTKAATLQPNSECFVCPKLQTNPDLTTSHSSYSDSAIVVPSQQESSSENAVIPEDMYNSFHYWRTPIPAIDLDLELRPESSDLQESKAPAQADADASFGSLTFSTATRRKLEEMLENLEPHTDDPEVKAQVDVLTAALRASNLSSTSNEVASAELPDNSLESQEDPMISNLLNSDPEDVPLTAEISAAFEVGFFFRNNNFLYYCNAIYFKTSFPSQRFQDVIPQPLLDQYLSMTDPSRAQTVDTEIAKHCAYSLPGVALTLGKQNWHCLKNTYETLASDMQWKVRRTLAFSIHELAGILGDQLTTSDLVPIFNGFLKDLDEVRIGVLKHLYDFLKLLQPEKRREYLSQLQEFMVTDNSRNWRFRAELAEYMILLLELYSPKDVYDSLRPIALSLCSDKVSSVRWIAYKLVGEMIRKCYVTSTPGLAVDFMNELVDKFCHCAKWSGRQSFVFVCQAVIEDDCIPIDQFTEHLMPHLLQLVSDPVPNVRVLLAKTLRQTLLEKEYFLNSASSHQEAVEQITVALQADQDRDVRYFASIYPNSTKLGDDAMSTASSTY
uniref:Serine/threonine-protein phosphatase 4 regulatory subunit 1 n=1 Tax=Callorhinchus milii TaxID=7868 RepID=A0A4W3IRM6_CALMI